MNTSLNKLQTGLSSEEALKLFAKFGPNELENRKTSLFKVTIAVLGEPMLLLLLACGLLYVLLGDLEEAAMLSFAVIAVISITIYQKRKSENALASLRKLSPLLAKVIRDGKMVQISAKEVVPNDIALVKEGDRVPADGFLLSSLNLHIDESLLTGESVSVAKQYSKLGEIHNENSNRLYAGSTVVSGEGIFKVNNTGNFTEIGKIGKELGSISSSESPLQLEIKRFTLLFSLFAGLLCIFLILGLGFRSGNWLQALLAGLTFSMAVIPEELPVVLSIFFSLGAWRISKIGVLTRELSAIETLGAATVLCVDKTGTLTENKMKVQGLFYENEYLDCSSDLKEMPEKFHTLLEFAVLASQKDPHDPMEKAIQELGLQYLSKTEHIHPNWQLEKEYPLTQKLLALSYAWLSKENSGQIFVGAKGAPEAIFDLCHFSPEKMEKWTEITEEYALEGFRILGVAKSFVKNQNLPSDQHDLDFEFLGLVVLEDPIRESVPSAISDCNRAGIKVVMITGDHSGTATAIAKKIGLQHPDSILTGAELQNLSDSELDYKLEKANIFSRIRPHQKLKIVKRLQSKGETVAMTGDGVNDALALQAAHIGISMGKRGTDVAREASDLVLLDDNFSSIVKSILLGRQIYENIKKSVSYIISVHIPIIGMSLLPVFTGDPLFLLPAHVLLFELIIDPSCSLVFEGLPAENAVGSVPPRSRTENLLGLKNFLLSLLQGGSVLFVLLALYFFGKESLWTHEKIRSLGFLFLIASNFGLIFSNLSYSKPFFKVLPKDNYTIYWILALTILIITIIFHNSLLLRLFGLEPIGFQETFISLGLGLTVSFIWEFRKMNILHATLSFSKNEF